MYKSVLWGVGKWAFPQWQLAKPHASWVTSPKRSDFWEWSCIGICLPHFELKAHCNLQNFRWRFSHRTGLFFFLVIFLRVLSRGSSLVPVNLYEENTIIYGINRIYSALGKFIAPQMRHLFEGDANLKKRGGKRKREKGRERLGWLCPVLKVTSLK